MFANQSRATVVSHALVQRPHWPRTAPERHIDPETNAQFRAAYFACDEMIGDASSTLERDDALTLVLPGNQRNLVLDLIMGKKRLITVNTMRKIDRFDW